MNENLCEHIRLHAKIRTNSYARKALTNAADYLQKNGPQMLIVEDIARVHGTPGIGASTIACIRDWFTCGCPQYTDYPWKPLSELPGITMDAAKALYDYGARTQDILARYKAGDIVGGIKITPALEICARNMVVGRFKHEEAGVISRFFKGIPCGSFRRAKETVGDLDIVCFNREDYLQNVSQLDFIIGSGDKKTSGLKMGRQVDIRVGDWATVLYLTGSKEFNISQRSIAKKMDFTLNEYGLFYSNGTRLDTGNSEEEIFKHLGMEYVMPPLRG
jgi:DNA polymerase/3'-5' exonuclease PolX